MPLMPRPRSLAVLLLTTALGFSSAWSTTVSSGGVGKNGVLTDLGSFIAGTYRIDGSGVVNLTGDLTGGIMKMNPDGTPAEPVTWAQYLTFNPDGALSADGLFGQAGNRAKIGALIGTLSASPTAPSDWFLIGFGTSLTLGDGQHIYASVNDTFHQNNTGSFEVSVTAVPEPSSALLLGLGFAACLALRMQRFAPARTR